MTTYATVLCDTLRLVAYVPHKGDVELLAQPDLGQWSTAAKNHLLHWLIVQYDPSTARSLFASCWPIKEPSQLRDFRIKCVRYLEHLKRQELLLSDVQIRASYFDDARGIRFEICLLALANLVLMKQVEQDMPQPSRSDSMKDPQRADEIAEADLDAVTLALLRTVPDPALAAVHVQSLQYHTQLQQDQFMAHVQRRAAAERDWQATHDHILALREMVHRDASMPSSLPLSLSSPAPQAAGQFPLIRGASVDETVLRAMGIAVRSLHWWRRSALPILEHRHVLLSAAGPAPPLSRQSLFAAKALPNTAVVAFTGQLLPVLAAPGPLDLNACHDALLNVMYEVLEPPTPVLGATYGHARRGATGPPPPARVCWWAPDHLDTLTRDEHALMAVLRSLREDITCIQNDIAEHTSELAQTIQNHPSRRTGPGDDAWSTLPLPEAMVMAAQNAAYETPHRRHSAQRLSASSRASSSSPAYAASPRSRSPVQSAAVMVAAAAVPLAPFATPTAFRRSRPVPATPDAASQIAVKMRRLSPIASPNASRDDDVDATALEPDACPTRDSMEPVAPDPSPSRASRTGAAAATKAKARDRFRAEWTAPMGDDTAAAADPLGLQMGPSSEPSWQPAFEDAVGSPIALAAEPSLDHEAPPALAPLTPYGPATFAGATQQEESPALPDPPRRRHRRVEHTPLGAANDVFTVAALNPHDTSSRPRRPPSPSPWSPLSRGARGDPSRGARPLAPGAVSDAGPQDRTTLEVRDGRQPTVSAAAALDHSHAVRAAAMTTPPASKAGAAGSSRYPASATTTTPIEDEHSPFGPTQVERDARRHRLAASPPAVRTPTSRPPVPTDRDPPASTPPPPPPAPWSPRRPGQRPPPVVHTPIDDPDDLFAAARRSKPAHTPFDDATPTKLSDSPLQERRPRRLRSPTPRRAPHGGEILMSSWRAGGPASRPPPSLHEPPAYAVSRSPPSRRAHAVAPPSFPQAGSDHPPTLPPPRIDPVRAAPALASAPTRGAARRSASPSPFAAPRSPEPAPSSYPSMLHDETSVDPAAMSPPPPRFGLIHTPPQSARPAHPAPETPPFLPPTAQTDPPLFQRWHEAADEPSDEAYDHDDDRGLADARVLDGHSSGDAPIGYSIDVQHDDLLSATQLTLSELPTASRDPTAGSDDGDGRLDPMRPSRPSRVLHSPVLPARAAPPLAPWTSAAPRTPPSPSAASERRLTDTALTEAELSGPDGFGGAMLPPRHHVDSFFGPMPDAHADHAGTRSETATPASTYAPFIAGAVGGTPRTDAESAARAHAGRGADRRHDRLADMADWTYGAADVLPVFAADMDSTPSGATSPRRSTAHEDDGPAGFWRPAAPPAEPSQRPLAPGMASGYTPLRRSSHHRVSDRFAPRPHAAAPRSSGGVGDGEPSGWRDDPTPSEWLIDGEASDLLDESFQSVL
ncbi:hypothetical protein CXG81DRAFT_18037 [Caulochytrium protostelioides]|uniref:HAUS augmin-like complex subunit 6 N-terminal domain-containing protein n=1 Tax=Caulochytrium protostelioides TaxID=1555241 RepID=A0A4P9XAB3_9FUNG|nr:hypothetical protein CXG81DRAFT_18037 [Caulochytrium protostelioides]|eukprot:RKP02287.1 hypothetical protein CXG81DRAFT_18037 [Caulochytrium protostelioides]